MDADKLRLKKIKVEELKVGMFSVNMERSWFKHPFLSGKKMITSEKQIEKLREYGVQGVYIDPERGQGVVAAEPAAQSSVPPAQAIVGVEEEKVLLQELSAPAPQTGLDFSSGTPKGHIILAKEIEMARVVQREAPIVIRDIMQDVRLGKNSGKNPSVRFCVKMFGSTSFPSAFPHQFCQTGRPCPRAEAYEARASF